MLLASVVIVPEFTILSDAYNVPLFVKSPLFVSVVCDIFPAFVDVPDIVKVPFPLIVAFVLFVKATTEDVPLFLIVPSLEALVFIVKAFTIRDPLLFNVF